MITFLSDYGVQDDFVGVCHGVMAGICPSARIIDLTHGVGRHDVRAGALILDGALPYLPVGVHVAVVDPDVGAARRAVAMRVADDRILVGPDNGLLSLAARRAGGVVQAVDIAHSRFRLEPVSATFHGRDIFAPVAARLAAGEPLADAGDPCDPDGLVQLSLPEPELADGRVLAHALYVDRFGNIGLNVSHGELAQLGFKLGRPVRLDTGSGDQEVNYVRTFADVAQGELMVYEDAYRRLAVAVSHGNAAELLGTHVGDRLRISAT
ncbi:MAG TPA: SAM-dependent chlorinase/fluorinase [Solirubrobacteraceae bacterium]|nr:SAM-dependent chlorinase/fluorinase [Solirubrobacteraceae bacterium]